MELTGTNKPITSPHLKEVTKKCDASTVRFPNHQHHTPRLTLTREKVPGVGSVDKFTRVTAAIARRETPGSIPNPEAKPLSADGTALETGWESRTPPNTH